MTSSGTGNASVGPGATSSVPVDPAAVSAARTAIDAANLADEATLEAISAVRVTDAGVEAAAQAIRGDASGDALWAATWIYTGHGVEPDVLAPLLANPDPSIRAMAATTLLAWGRLEAVRVAIDLIPEQGNVRGSEPPLSLSDFARGALDREIQDPPIGLDAAPADAAAAWTTWIAANEAALRFDPATGLWSVP